MNPFDFGYAEPCVAQRQAFQRARQNLVADGHVATHDGRYWIPALKRNKAEQSGTFVPVSSGG